MFIILGNTNTVTYVYYKALELNMHIFGAPVLTLHLLDVTASLSMGRLSQKQIVHTMPYLWTGRTMQGICLKYFLLIALLLMWIT